MAEPGRLRDSARRTAMDTTMTHLGLLAVALNVLVIGMVQSQSAGNPVRPRARDVGVVVGVLPAGKLNAITDVPGVRVGHATLIRGKSVRTGVTAIILHDGNLFQEKVPAAIFVG